MGGLINASLPMIVETPAISSINEQIVARAMVHGSGVLLSGYEFYVVNHNGAIQDVTTSLLEQPYVQGKVTVWEYRHTPIAKGMVTFFFYDKVSTDTFVASCFVAESLSNMDGPISDLSKLRTEVSRVRTLIRR